MNIKKIHLIPLFVASFFLHVLIEYYYFASGNAWIYGDWLINYSDGFIRRGLTGAALLLIPFDINIGLVLFLFKSSLYAGIAYLVYHSIKEEELTLYLPLLISPALFLFPINDFAAIGRKEYLFFIIIAFTVWRLINRQKPYYSLIYMVIYPMLILTHEMLILTLPFILFLQFNNSLVSYKSISKITLSCIPSIVAFSFCIIYKEGDSDMIYATIKDTGYALKNGGAIDALSIPIEHYLSVISNNSTLAYRFIPYFLLSFVGFYFIRSKFYNLSFYGIVLLALPLIGYVILSFVAIDYGRWIHIYLMGVFFISLVSNVKITPVIIEKKDFAVILIFNLSWALPHYLFGGGIPIWLNVAKKIIGKIT